MHARPAIWGTWIAFENQPGLHHFRTQEVLELGPKALLELPRRAGAVFDLAAPAQRAQVSGRIDIQHRVP